MTIDQEVGERPLRNLYFPFGAQEGNKILVKNGSN